MTAYTPIGESGTDFLTANKVSRVVIAKAPWDINLPRYAKTIAKYDANKDGALSEDEWSNMPRDPSPADHDKDGLITPEELTKYATTLIP